MHRTVLLKYRGLVPQGEHNYYVAEEPRLMSLRVMVSQLNFQRRKLFQHKNGDICIS